MRKFDAESERDGKSRKPFRQNVGYDVDRRTQLPLGLSHKEAQAKLLQEQQDTVSLVQVQLCPHKDTQE